jgi:hypothetical protein
MKPFYPSLTRSSESERFRTFPPPKPQVFLKNVIRNNIKKEDFQAQLFSDLLLFESKIDELGLIAFNLYMNCREKIYELKANEMKNTTFRAFERAGLVRETPADKPDLDNINICKEASNDK